MSDDNQILPPNATPLPPTPFNLKRYVATCTAIDGTQAVLNIDALNHLGAINTALAWLCNNPVVIKKFLVEEVSGKIIPASLVPPSGRPLGRG